MSDQAPKARGLLAPNPIPSPQPTTSGQRSSLSCPPITPSARWPSSAAARASSAMGCHYSGGNGRDHLVDALQEALDLMTYLRAAGWTDRGYPFAQWLAETIATEIGGRHV